jgi:hypothetical protein
MAAVPIVFNGVMVPKGKGAGDKPVPAIFVGYASIAGLEVGGGPIIPDEGPPDPPIDGIPPEPPTGSNIAVVIKPAPVTGGWGLAQQGGDSGTLTWYFVPGVAGPKR